MEFAGERVWGGGGVINGLQFLKTNLDCNSLAHREVIQAGHYLLVAVTLMSSINITICQTWLKSDVALYSKEKTAEVQVG